MCRWVEEVGRGFMVVGLLGVVVIGKVGVEVPIKVEVQVQIEVVRVVGFVAVLSWVLAGVCAMVFFFFFGG